MYLPSLDDKKVVLTLMAIVVVVVLAVRGCLAFFGV